MKIKHTRYTSKRLDLVMAALHNAKVLRFWVGIKSGSQSAGRPSAVAAFFTLQDGKQGWIKP